MSDLNLVVIKGAGDIPSAIAYRVKQAGGNPVLLEVNRPLITRRLMAFAPALHGDSPVIEGLRGVGCETAEQAIAVASEPGVMPVLALPEGGDTANAVQVLSSLAHVMVVVDGRMKKKQAPPEQIQEAPLVIGVGPGFVAGQHAHGVIETSWGDDLGRVIWQGSTLDYTGIHRKVEGHGAERYIYAPHNGVFRTEKNIPDAVQPGDVVGRIDDTPLKVEIGGVLRGLAYNGTPVSKGAKLVEVEPRGDITACSGIARRPAQISDGVLQAIRERAPGLL